MTNFLQKKFFSEGALELALQNTSCWFVLLLLGLNISMAEGEEGNWEQLWLPAMLDAYFTKLFVGLTTFSMRKIFYEETPLDMRSKWICRLNYFSSTYRQSHFLIWKIGMLLPILPIYDFFT